MAVDTQSTLSAAEVLAALVPLVGTTGIAGIIVAWLGYRKAQREGRGSASLGPESQTGIAVLYAEQATLQTAALALERLAGAIERLNKSVEGVDFHEFIEELRRYRHFMEDEARKR